MLSDVLVEELGLNILGWTMSKRKSYSDSNQRCSSLCFEGDRKQNVLKKSEDVPCMFSCFFFSLLIYFGL